MFLLALYALCLVLWLLMLRPRLIIYNVSADQLRPILAELVEQLDSDARWAGDMLVLPSLGVQLHVDSLAVMRNVSLTSVGRSQNPLGWQRLERALGAALGQVPTARNARGAILLVGGLLILSGLGYAVACDPQGVTQALFDMLRL